MKNRSYSLAVSALILSALGPAFTGCGGEALYPVSGTVTLDGQPLSDAAISFIAAEKNVEGGVASTDASGKYEVTHLRGGSGLPAGKYKVIIAKVLMPDGKPVPKDLESGAGVAFRESIPAQYSDYDKTTLTATVESGGKPIDFSLKSK